MGTTAFVSQLLVDEVNKDVSNQVNNSIEDTKFLIHNTKKKVHGFTSNLKDKSIEKITDFKSLGCLKDFSELGVTIYQIPLLEKLNEKFKPVVTENYILIYDGKSYLVYNKELKVIFEKRGEESKYDMWEEDKDILVLGLDEVVVLKKERKLPMEYFHKLCNIHSSYRISKGVYIFNLEVFTLDFKNWKLKYENLDKTFQKSIGLVCEPPRYFDPPEVLNFDEDYLYVKNHNYILKYDKKNGLFIKDLYSHDSTDLLIFGNYLIFFQKYFDAVRSFGVFDRNTCEELKDIFQPNGDVKYTGGLVIGDHIGFKVESKKNLMDIYDSNLKFVKQITYDKTLFWSRDNRISFFFKGLFYYGYANELIPSKKKEINPLKRILMNDKNQLISMMANNYDINFWKVDIPFLNDKCKYLSVANDYAMILTEKDIPILIDRELKFTISSIEKENVTNSKMWQEKEGVLILCNGNIFISCTKYGTLYLKKAASISNPLIFLDLKRIGPWRYIGTYHDTLADIIGSAFFHFDNIYCLFQRADILRSPSTFDETKENLYIYQNNYIEKHPFSFDRIDKSLSKNGNNNISFNTFLTKTQETFKLGDNYDIFIFKHFLIIITKKEIHVFDKISLLELEHNILNSLNLNNASISQLSYQISSDYLIINDKKSYYIYDSDLNFKQMIQSKNQLYISVYTDRIGIIDNGEFFYGYFNLRQKFKIKGFYDLNFNFE